MAISGHRPPRLECKNPRRNAAVYHAKRLGFFRDLTVKNAVFRCSSYVALPAIIPHGRGDGERLIYGGGGDVGHSVSQVEKVEEKEISGWQLIKRNGVVTIRKFGEMKITSWQNTTVFNIPEGWRPKMEVYAAVPTNGSKIAMIQASPSCSFNLRGLGGGDISTYCFATLTYVAE